MNFAINIPGSFLSHHPHFYQGSNLDCLWTSYEWFVLRKHSPALSVHFHSALYCTHLRIFRLQGAEILLITRLMHVLSSTSKFTYATVTEICLFIEG